jgi:hypothetical protein
MLRIIKGLVIFVIAFLVFMPAGFAQATPVPTPSPCSPSDCMPATPPPHTQSSDEGTPPGDPAAQGNAVTGGSNAVDGYTREPKIATIKHDDPESSARSRNIPTSVQVLLMICAVGAFGFLIAHKIRTRPPRK